MVDAAGSAALGELRPLELACGFVHGADPTVAPLPDAPTNMSARGAMEQVVRHALEQPPCVVSFSGGRDSSAMLALAMHVAQRDTLPEPVPVTLQFPGRPEADENEWQESVVRHLAVQDWVKIPCEDELDFVGPHAATMLRRHGLLWPPNVHSHLPIAACAVDGSMITGFGGDELLIQDPLQLRVNRVLSGRARPQRRDVARIATFLGPRSLRERLIVKHLTPQPRPWLRPDTERAVRQMEVSSVLGVPLRWDRSLDEGWWRLRYRRIAEAGLSAVGNVYGTSVHNPFAHPLALAAIAREAGRVGFRNRAAAMAQLFGDLLPEGIARRESKAVLSRGFWTKHAAAFAERWDGRGVDAGLVDPDILRDVWTGRRDGDIRTAPLLQGAWLATEGFDTA